MHRSPPRCPTWALDAVAKSIDPCVAGRFQPSIPLPFRRRFRGNSRNNAYNRCGEAEGEYYRHAKRRKYLNPHRVSPIPTVREFGVQPAGARKSSVRHATRMGSTKLPKRLLHPKMMRSLPGLSTYRTATHRNRSVHRPTLLDMVCAERLTDTNAAEKPSSRSSQIDGFLWFGQSRTGCCPVRREPKYA